MSAAAMPPTRSWLLPIFVVSALLQVAQPIPRDADSAYHFYIGQRIAELGWPKEMGATRFSWLAEHYSDSEPFFHLLYAWLSPLGYVPASQLLGTLLTAAVLWSMVAVAQRMGAERPGLWTMIGAFSSGYWVLRMALVRPYLPAIVITLWLVAFAAERKWRWVLAISLLFPSVYIGFHVGIVLVAIVECARFLLERRVDWRVVAASVGGTILGLVVHPYFPKIVSHFWVENVLTLGKASVLNVSTVQVGPEFSAMTLDVFLQVATAPFAILAAALVLVALEPQVRRRALPFVLVAAAFALLTVRSQRFIEYLVPFATVALACAWPAGRWPRAVYAFGAAAPLWFFGWTGKTLVDRLRDRPDVVNPQVIEALGPHLPAGAKVYTCGWLLTGELLRAFPDRLFMVALDPMLFYYAHPKQYEQWQSFQTNPPADVAAQIRTSLDSDYVLCEYTKRSEPLRVALNSDPTVTLVAREYPWELWALSVPPPADSLVIPSVEQP